jgi:pyroglutamyl-peptidase
VGFGVHATAETLRVERVARNRIAGARPDNAGIIPSAVAVDGGPLALSGTFAAPLVYDRVRAVGVPVRLSHDAGTYLCNYAYYRALHWNRDRGGAVGFVHVPPAEIVAVPTLVSAAKAAIEAAVAAKRSVPTAPASA